MTNTEKIKIALFFSALSIWYTYPIVLNINGITDGDGYAVPQGFWWFKKAITSFQNPFYTDYIFYPQGTSLVFGSNFSNFLLTLPVNIVAGANAAGNMAYILSFLLSGYFAFLLAYELTGNKYASVIAGIIYGFNPFRCRGVGHLNIVTVQWLPLYLLMFKRSSERNEKRWPILAGLVFSAIVLNDQLNTILAAYITAFALPLLFFKYNTDNSGKIGLQVGLRPDYKKNVKALLIIALAAAILSGGYLYQLIHLMLEEPDIVKIDPFEHGGANQFSGDIMGYLLPPPIHPLWGKFVSLSLHPENILFLGYIPVFLAFVGAVRFFHKGIVKFIIAITLFFWVLSLGMTLHVGGVWQWNSLHLKLPFSFLSWLPLIGGIRTPSRFHIVTTLGVSLLAAYGTTWLLNRKNMAGTGAKNWKIIFLAGLILIEFLPVKVNIQDPVRPKIYLEMAKDKEPYTILELPLSRWSSFVRNGSGSPHVLLQFQPIHEKKIFNGFLSRVSTESLNFNDGILETFTKLTWQDNYGIVGFGKRLPTEAEFKEARELGTALSFKRDDFIKRYNIRYIVMHAPIATGTMTRTFVEAFTGEAATYVPEDNLSYIKIQ